MPETVSQDSDLPSPRLAIGKEKIDGSLDKEVVGSLVLLDESKKHEIEAYKPMDVEGGVVVLETILQKSSLPLSFLAIVEENIEGSLTVKEINIEGSLAVEEENIEGSSNKEHVGSSNESKRNDAKGYGQQHVEGERFVPKTIPQKFGMPLSTLTIEEEKVKGSLAVDVDGFGSGIKKSNPNPIIFQRRIRALKFDFKIRFE